MLTVQPKFSNYGIQPSFNARGQFEEYVNDMYPDTYDSDKFDLELENEKSKQELDLWEETKHNLDNIAKTTESVPVLKKGTTILSGLISVAIGWGGLRWGTGRTLEVLSGLSESRLAKSVSGFMKKTFETSKSGLKSVSKFVKGTGFYSKISSKVSSWKQALVQTSFGQRIIKFKDAVKSNSLYNKAVCAKNNSVDYVKKLNPKQIFIETMGVAGGGTALVNTIGGKTVDGVKHNVEQNEDGDYFIDGQKANIRRGDFADVA